jgi:branched-chain amino acid transport system substrate-binding protein
MKIFRFPALAGAGALLAGLAAPAGAADNTPIKVPVVTPLTGPLALLGQDSKKGIELAVEHINAAGGIAGRPLAVEVADTQGKPDVMRREMERLAKLENAPMIVGCEISAATAAAAQFAEQFKIPYLNSGAVSAEILRRGYKWYFTDQVTGDDEAATVVAFFKQLAAGAGGKDTRIAYLYEDSPRGAGTADSVRKLLADEGFAPVADVSYNRSERNLLPFVKKVQQATPKVVVWIGYTEDVVAGLKAMQELDFAPYVIGVGGGPGDLRIPQLVDPAFVAKVHLTNVDYFSPDIKRAERFTKAYLERHGIEPSSYASMCYRGAYTLKATLEKVLEGKKPIDRTSIQAALRSIDIPGEDTVSPYRFIRFDADGRNLGAQELVAQWKDGGRRKVTVFPADIAVGQPDPLN